MAEAKVLPISSVIRAATSSASASRRSAVDSAQAARSEKLVVRYCLKRSCARPMAASISASDAAVKVLIVSPVAGLIVAIGMSPACHYRRKDEHSCPINGEVFGERGRFCGLRNTGGREHPVYPGARGIGHPLHSDPSRAGRGVHGGNVWPGHRACRGGVRHVGSWGDQPTAGSCRRVDEQHTFGRDRRPGRPGSGLQRIASIRGPGGHVPSDHPVGGWRSYRPGHPGDVPQGLQACRDRTAGGRISGSAREHRRRRCEL
ncbi:Uncharacterised protein [Mycobacteroides abscessus]|nr:Uncharacterised protein [Mycobacteroides abscessus]